MPLSRPFVSAAKWVETFADDPTKEYAYLNALRYREADLVREIALEGLWRLDKTACLGSSEKIAKKEPENVKHLLRHAKYCVGLYYYDEAKEHYERAITAARRSSIQEPSMKDILFEYLTFLSNAGFTDDAATISGFSLRTHATHPIFLRVMFFLHGSQGDYDCASQCLTGLFQHIRKGKGHRRSVGDIIRILSEAGPSAACVGRVKISKECLDACAQLPGDIVNLLKIAILLEDRESAEACWAVLLLEHRDYVNLKPELRLYYESNMLLPDEILLPAPDHEGCRSAHGGRDPFDRLIRVGRLGRNGPRNQDGPKVSVIMTSWNSAETIGYAMESILNQSAGNLELLVVDDCSTDDTPQIVARMAQRDARVRLTVNAENVGPYRSRNVALGLATGEFVAIHDADDAALPNRLEIQLSAFSEGVQAVLGSHIRMDRDGRVRLENDNSILGHGPMTLMFRREVAGEIGKFAKVRTRGDKEYESRIEHFYGAHALRRIPDLLVYSLHSEESNSRALTRTLEKKRDLVLFKQSYHRAHTALALLVPHEVKEADPVSDLPRKASA